MKKLIRLLLAGSALASIVSCGSGDDSSSLSLGDAIIEGISKEKVVKKEEENKIPREETLYLVGFQWGEPSSFNPLNGYPAWPARYEFNLMYEPLTVYNSLTGKVEPLLGRLHEFTPDSITVIMNKAAKWSDGTPLTGEDVKWTFELHGNNSASPCHFVKGYISEIKLDTLYTIDSSKSTSVQNDSTAEMETVAVYDTTNREERVTFMVAKERNIPFGVLDNISNIPVLPKHVFEPKLKRAGGDIYGTLDDNMAYPQVVSGPYNYHSHTNEKIVVSRRDDYWGNEALHGGKKPAPKYIIHPIYKGNDHASSNLKQGNLDISANYMPRIWLKRDKGVQTWFDDFPYYKAGSIPMFIINATKAPLNDKRFRRAMALSIDYEKLKTIAVTGYTDDIQPGLLLPLGTEKKYISKEDLDTYGATRFNIEEARSLLKEAGFTSHYKDTTKGKDGKLEFGDLEYMLNSKGEKVETIEVMSVAGWTDFEWIVRLAVQSMRKAGIDVRPGLVDYPRYEDAKYTGKFDLFMDTPAAKLSASMPWTRFEKVMSSANWKQIGEKMYENTGRFNQPGTEGYIYAIDSILKSIPTMTDSAEIAAGYRRLNQYYMEEQPTIPLLYRPEEFYQFSNKVWTNFPVDGDNDNIPPYLPVSMAGTKLLWRIKPAKGGK